jgi:hypothetical protein
MTRKKSKKFINNTFILFSLLLVANILLINCGGGGSDGGTTTTVIASGTGTVITHITDPPVCKEPEGSVQHVWITITRVMAHMSQAAGPSETGWIDLVDLRDKPMQIDLLSLDSTSCILTVLGSAGGIPEGKYQQIRLYLLSNSPAVGEVIPSPNECAGQGYNCIVKEGITHELRLSSQEMSGIKIPPGQISGGGLTVTAGQTVNLTIDFDACSSIVEQGNSDFRLKPTLHAGQVIATANSISGRVVNTSTGLPIANAVVLVETRDSGVTPNIDRVYAQRTTDADGLFVFCPIPSGTYDLVIAARTGVVYFPAITLQVPAGQDTGDIPLLPESLGKPLAGIAGKVSASNGGAPVDADITLTSLYEITLAGSTPLRVTMPLFLPPSSQVTVDTIPGTCGTGCANYTLFVQAINPQIGTFRASPPTSYSPPATGSTVYYVHARAFAPLSGGQLFCTPSSITATGIAVIAGSTTIAPDISFTGCQY